MGLKRMLGLAAIGGAIVYAYKKRGGNLEEVKKFANDLLANLRGEQVAGDAREPLVRPPQEPRTPYGGYSPKSPNGVR